ncbi:MAG: hypothetical protein ACJ8CR_38000 [Roseiflexaceae bacterium]
MAPLLVLIAVTLLARGVGLVWTALDSWVEAARVGLAVMLIFTPIHPIQAVKDRRKHKFGGNLRGLMYWLSATVCEVGIFERDIR